MSNSHVNRKGKRKGSAKYALSGHRDRNKRRRMARDVERKNPLPCGHGSRHLSPYDHRCRRCFGEVR